MEKKSWSKQRWRHEGRENETTLLLNRKTNSDAVQGLWLFSNGFEEVFHKKHALVTRVCCFFSQTLPNLPGSLPWNICIVKVHVLVSDLWTWTPMSKLSLMYLFLAFPLSALVRPSSLHTQHNPKIPIKNSEIFAMIRSNYRGDRLTFFYLWSSRAVVDTKEMSSWLRIETTMY